MATEQSTATPIVFTLREKYREYLRSDDWRRKRATKYRSVKNKRCAFCQSEKHLDVHHLVYKDWHSVRSTDLRLVCRACHDLIHQLLSSRKLVYTSDNPAARFAQTQRALLRHWAGVERPTPKPKRIPKQPKQFRVTAAWLEENRTPALGFTRTQLAALNVSWPPQGKWKKRLLGAFISEASRQTVEAPRLARVERMSQEVRDLDEMYANSIE